VYLDLVGQGTIKVPWGRPRCPEEAAKETQKEGIVKNVKIKYETRRRRARHRKIIVISKYIKFRLKLDKTDI
jgi:hypothetical protein